MGNWLQMWGSMAPAPARRQGRIKSSAQGRRDRRGASSPQKHRLDPILRYWPLGLHQSVPSLHLNPCSSSAKITKPCLKTSQLPLLLVYLPKAYFTLDLDFYTDNMKSLPLSLQGSLCLGDYGDSNLEVKSILCHCVAAIVFALIVDWQVMSMSGNSSL